MTRHLCCRLAGFALTLALLTAGSSGAPTARPGAPNPIAFARPAAHDANDGDIWLTSGEAGGERRLTRVGGLSALAAHRGRLACIRSSDGNPLMLAPPEWIPKRLTSLGLFAGKPTWTPDGSALLVGRQPLPEGGR